MKVLHGQFKNRKLVVPSGIRPVSLRVKKSLFDILREEIKGARVLDLFSGSGSLGIEALSLGAEEAVFVDSRRACVEAVGTNLSLVKMCSKGRVIFGDTCKSVRSLSLKKEAFDVVFLDPPYSQGLSRKALQTIDEYDILSPRGWIIESGFYKDETSEDYRNFYRAQVRRYGQSLITFYLKEK